MQYPTALANLLGSAAELARQCSAHPAAPRSVTGEAVCAWSYRNSVPWPWRAVVSDLLKTHAKALDAAAKPKPAPPSRFSGGGAGAALAQKAAS